MDIIEFQKRWIMRYINPIFFYLPFQSCQVNEIGFYIKVLLWNTYNPVKDEYKNRLTEEKGLLINRPCDYYKILITYLGDESKDDKTRREELVYCSSLNNGGQKESYDEGVLYITQMADGSSLKPGRYKAHIFATYGMGAPAKQDDVNYYQYFEFYPYKDNGRTYPIYVNWHLVELKTYTGDPTYTWEHNKGPYQLGETPRNFHWGNASDSFVNHPPFITPETQNRPEEDQEYEVRKTFLNWNCKLSNCQTHQIMNDTFDKHQLAKVPLQEQPISYNKQFVFAIYCGLGLTPGYVYEYTPKFSIATSRCCFDMSQSYSQALWGGVVSNDLVRGKAYGWKGTKGTLNVSLEEHKGGFQLKDGIGAEDVVVRTPEYVFGGYIDLNLSYEYWNNFLPGPDPKGSFLDPNRLDGSDYKNITLTNGNLPSVYLSFNVERSQEMLYGEAGLGAINTNLNAYHETETSYSGYRRTDFMGQRAVVPIGGDYQAFKQGIFACKDGSSPQQTKYVDAYDEIKFGPPDKYAEEIETFDLYNMVLFELEGKNGYYTKSELADALVDIESYKPWSDEELELGECEENPKYQFTFEMTADEGKYELRRQKREEDPENPILFYLNKEQAWKGCTGYALCDFLPAELPYPDLSIYQTNKKEETVSEN